MLSAESSKNTTTSKRPSKLWLLFGLMVLSICLIVQLPISWVIQKYLPNSPYIQSASGNLLKGSANWQMTQPSSGNKPKMFNGNVSWQLKPLKLFMGKLSSDIQITSEKSRLNGNIDLKLNLKSLQLNNVKGIIHPSTLAKMVQWQFPDTPIQVNQLSIDYHKTNGFKDVSGELTWIGGTLGYPNEGQMLKINLPAMKATISDEQKDKVNSLHAHLVNEEDKTLGDFYLDNTGMLDISLTQRLLENMPSYQGSAPQDTAVVSIRQPLFNTPMANTASTPTNISNPMANTTMPTNAPVTNQQIPVNQPNLNQPNPNQPSVNGSN